MCLFKQLFQVRQVVDDNNVRDALYVHVNVDVVCMDMERNKELR